jgi:hypothetical protein
MAASKKLPLFSHNNCQAFQFQAGKRHYPVKRFNKRNIGDLVTASIEQFSKRPVIRLYPMLVRQKHISQENNSGVGHQSIIVTALHLLCQLQMLFGHLEKHLDIQRLP